ncbi:hypothetical protein HCI99_04845 [Listeria booriae]|uniref:Uncharacterized protein n=1 Tax=Listeria booriae TaxID=1552123 RepID=A0A7X1CB07_9LIST|nr:hypothetical protein [Listeria booriae]MBC1490939.1 hypothetical protein [Listeria booriae]MBC1491146.1 hypothetical protein [Listeria booriae]MBC6151022.1 hypothetical protein [Listeria booriae]MBC6151229.1 hypothetical protein [Listeria booriae]
MKEEKKISDARKRANAKWQKENAEKAKYYRAKSATKKFISEIGTKKDLIAFKKLIEERIQKFK